MTRPTVVTLAAAFTAVALTACGPSAHHALPKPTSSAVVAGEAQAKQVLARCMPANILVLSSRTGRAAFAGCVKVPAAKRAAFTACLTTAAGKDHLLTRAGRDEFAQVSAPGCYEASR